MLLFFAEQQQANVGCVLKKKVIMATTNPEQCFNTPLKVEFLAIFRGLQLYVPLSIQTLIVESDSFLAVQVIQEEEESPAQHITLIEEILVLSKTF